MPIYLGIYFENIKERRIIQIIMKHRVNRIGPNESDHVPEPKILLKYICSLRKTNSFQIITSYIYSIRQIPIIFIRSFHK